MDEKTLARFLQQAASKQLSTRDRKLLQSFQMSPAEIQEDLLESISDNSLKELQAAIMETKDPKIQKILLEERKNVMAQRAKQPKEEETVLADIAELWNPN